VILDSSAIVALVLREPGWEAIADKLAAASTVGIGAPTAVETAIVLTARIRADSRALLARLHQEAGIRVVPFGEAHAAAAVDAWLRYGRGRHAAALNLGDCLSYATARVSGLPLLCVGDEFARTDLTLA
jgi:ribonuclease VapC